MPLPPNGNFELHPRAGDVTGRSVGENWASFHDKKDVVNEDWIGGTRRGYRDLSLRVRMDDLGVL